jgi:hypothetical protein
MSRITRFALLAGVLTLNFWLAGSQPAQAWESCRSLDGQFCNDPTWAPICFGDDQQAYVCDCTGNRLNCPW